jgi:rod shape-determining protein MreD
MSKRFKIITMAAVILLETAVLSRFKLWSATPDYMLVFLLAITTVCPDTDSVILAGACGLAFDFLSGSIFGLNTLLCIYFTCICAFFVDALYIKKMKVIVPMAFILSLFYELLFGIFCFLIRRADFSFWTIALKSAQTAFFNTLLFIPVYLILGRVRFEKKRKGIKYER